MDAVILLNELLQHEFPSLAIIPMNFHLSGIFLNAPTAKEGKGSPSVVMEEAEMHVSNGGHTTVQMARYVLHRCWQ